MAHSQHGHPPPTPPHQCEASSPGYGNRRRQLAGGECQRVIVLAAVERLTVAVEARERIRRFRWVVAVDACLRGGRALQPVAIVVGAVAWQPADTPTVDRLAGIGDGL